MKKYIIFILIISLGISFMIGVYLQKISNLEEIAFEPEYTKTEKIIKNAEDILAETSSVGNKTSPNTKIIEKKYYNDCGHLREEEKKIDEKLINKTESEFQIEYIGWEIQKFTPSEITVYKEVYDFCDEHYLLKEMEGEIIIYALDKNGNQREVIRETGIQTKYLSEVDIENLKKGINVYGEKDLNQIIEDYE